MQNFDGKNKITKLIQTIAELMQEREEDWVSWKVVAKRHEGSEEYADILAALAQLPNYSHYFSSSRKKVTLTEVGLQLVTRTPSSSDTFMQQIGRAVTTYASTLWPLKIEVESVATIAKAGNRFVHAVMVAPMDDVIASETPVDLIPKASSLYYGSKFHGKIVGQEADSTIFYVAFENNISAACLPAYLSVDRGFLLRQLASQLDELEGCPPLVDQIFSLKNTSSLSLVGDRDSKVVADKLAKLPTPWARFLWGPPGAGKTFALGRLIIQLLSINPHGKILLVAPSNRAVDVATEQLVTQLENISLRHLLDARKILRFGYPRKSTILQRTELLGPVGLDKLSARVKDISVKIEQAERDKASEDKLAVLKAERLEAQENVKKAVFDHVLQSRVVFTTTTMAYMKASPILEVAWSTVLIDEVTMVPPAMCVFLGSLARKRFLLAGDPRQLGPVYEESKRTNAETERWIGRDIFEVGDVSRGKGQSRAIQTEDNRLSRITSQRRCAANIWAEVEDLYPTIVNAVDQQALKMLINLPPLSGKSVVLLDTSNSSKNTHCQQENRSWKNKHSADVAMQAINWMLAEAETDISVAVISPYRAQTKLMRQLIREARKTVPEYAAVEAGTVHQFQGSDADVVIFDLVDGPNRKRPGNLLQGDTGLRLVNVAITRARGKVVIIAHKEWFEATDFQESNSLLWRLILNRPADESIRLPFPLDKLKETSQIRHRPNFGSNRHKREFRPLQRLKAEFNDILSQSGSIQSTVTEAPSQNNSGQQNQPDKEISIPTFPPAKFPRSKKTENQPNANSDQHNQPDKTEGLPTFPPANFPRPKKIENLSKVNSDQHHQSDEKLNVVSSAPDTNKLLTGQKRQLIQEILNFPKIGRNLSDADLEGVDLSGAYLYEANLSRANLTKANLCGVSSLGKATLDGAKLQEANLAGVELRDATMIKSDLRKAILKECNLFRVDLSQANLSHANLRRAKLASAVLQSANLGFADLRGANLSWAKLADADLFGADLREATLTGADLCGANLIGSDLRGVDLGRAKIDKTTKLRFGEITVKIDHTTQLPANWLEVFEVE